MATPRLLVLDLDGTTLRRDRSVAEIDLRAAQALREEGVGVSIATGRLWSGTRTFARLLGVEIPAACMNGSELRCGTSGEVRRRHGLSPEVRASLRSVLQRSGLATFFFGSDHIVHGRAGTDFLPLVRMWGSATREHASPWQSDLWRSGTGVLAVCGFGTRTAVAAARRELLARVPASTELAAFPSQGLHGWWYLVVRDGGNDKGTALDELAGAWGCTIDEVVAVGDYYNDVPMLLRAGRSFAMGQAPDDVKSQAGEVLAARNDTGGAVAEVARRVWGVEV